MGLKIWEFTTRYGSFFVKMEKDKAITFSNRVKPAFDLPAGHYFKEINGIVGGEERESTLYCIGGKPQPMREPETYEAEMSAFFASFPNPVTLENYQPVLQRAQEIFDAHVPIVDCRRTMEQEAERDAACRAAEEERERIHQEFLNRFALPETIEIPPGKMAVVLDITVDRSDSMSDYYHPHGSFPGGVELVLAVVTSQNETEALARRVLSQYPELNKHAFTWHTEKYSGGHGNYLESAVVREELTGTEKRGGHDAEVEVYGKYEVRFQKAYKRAFTLHPYKNYHNRQQAAQQEPGETISGGGSWSMRLNAEKNGVEIWSAEKPERDTIDRIKEAGFRWSFSSRLWYAKQNERTIAFAQAMSGAQAEAATA